MSITEIIALSGHVEKLGIFGVLVVVCCLLGYALVRLRQYYEARMEKMREELAGIYRQRDKARLALVKCKAALDFNGIKVDLTDVADLMNGGGS